MDTAQWVSIVVAVIGVLGVLIAAYWQIKRDGKTIDSISADTSEMGPTVKKIDESVAKAKDIIIESVKPSLDGIEKRNSRIDFIASELSYHKRLQRDFSDKAVGRDFILAGVNAVYEENARLNKELEDAQQRLIQMIGENNSLRSEVSKLSRELDLERAKTAQQNENPQQEI